MHIPEGYDLVVLAPDRSEVLRVALDRAKLEEAPGKRELVDRIASRVLGHVGLNATQQQMRRLAYEQDFTVPVAAFARELLLQKGGNIDAAQRNVRAMLKVLDGESIGWEWWHDVLRELDYIERRERERRDAAAE